MVDKLFGFYRKYRKYRKYHIIILFSFILILKKSWWQEIIDNKLLYFELLYNKSWIKSD